MAARKKTVTKLDSNYIQKYDAYIERQKRKRQRLFRRLILFSLIAMLAISSMAVYHSKQRTVRAEINQQYDLLESELVTLKNDEANYKEEVNLLNDEEYVLEVARTNYFFSKDGELIFKNEDEEPSY